MLVNDENKIELIDAYLDGRLGSDEVVGFETELKGNNDLRMEVQAQKAVRKNMVIQGRKELKIKLKVLHEEMLAENRDGSGVKDLLMGNYASDAGKSAAFSYRRKTIYAVAAAVIVLIASVFAFVSYQGSKQSEIAKQGKTYKIEMKDLGQVVMSFGGKESLVSDSLVLFVKGDDKYDFHYQFTDTLTIFSSSLDPMSGNIYVEHDTTKKSYLLIIDGKRYPLERGFIDINPLRQENELKD